MPGTPGIRFSKIYGAVESPTALAAVVGENWFGKSRLRKEEIQMPKRDGTGPPTGVKGPQDGRGKGKGRAQGKGAGKGKGSKKGTCK